MRRVLCYGDSNTFGTGPMATLADDPIHPKNIRWAGVMSDSLGAKWDVVVEGLPGRTTVFDDPVEGEYRNGLRPFQAILESHRPIDVLIICLGTNDTKQRFGVNSQDIALGVARLINEAKKLDVVDHVLIICPPPVRERGDLAGIFSGAEARCEGLPEQMERFATENEAAFLDAGALIKVDPLDGVHWSADSHEILGQAVAAKVRTLFS
ncbi:MAG: SGNH/GDSL hydrolase family protein [Boseongicola sp.]|nr:SGNH/GDSL hydrolase family protein [Boseongicola sp.]MDD9979420.1 SGNH/GDSL hydrolase family protein [Boseongicola sp.]